MHGQSEAQNKANRSQKDGYYQVQLYTGGIATQQQVASYQHIDASIPCQALSSPNGASWHARRSSNNPVGSSTMTSNLQESTSSMYAGTRQKLKKGVHVLDLEIPDFGHPHAFEEHL